jgi:phage-related protein (TIGR01555 family)
VKPTQLANDSAVGLSQRNAWANDEASLAVQALGGAQSYSLAWANGYGFMGYAYLAQLSQIAEYRQLAQTIAEEMTREWIEIKALGSSKKADKVRKLTQIVNDDLGMRENCKAYAEQDSYFGVGHLYLDTGDTNDPQELKQSIGNGRDKISKNKGVRIRAVRTVEPLWCYPNGYDTTNPLREDWYRPQQWLVNGIETHATRLLTGHLRPVPDILKPAYAFGGLALTQLAKPYVENWLRTRQSVADIVWRYTFNVLLTDLETLLQSAGDADNILARVQALNTLANNNGALVLNKDSEDFKNISTPLAGLHELQAQSQEHQAAVGRYPFVKLFGITPSGLNASSDGEIRVFYDTVHGCQTTLFNPVIRPVLDFAQLAEYGEIDPEITFVYRPLWQLDDERKSTLQKTRADTHAIYLTEGVVSAEEVREALSHDQESPYAGLDLDQVNQEGGEVESTGDDPAIRLAHHVLDLAIGDRSEEAEDWPGSFSAGAIVSRPQNASRAISTPSLR